jgi:hypothetical protein
VGCPACRPGVLGEGCLLGVVQIQLGLEGTSRS